jgi:hypothetical protein
VLATAVVRAGFCEFLFFDSLMHCGTTMYIKTLKEEFRRFFLHAVSVGFVEHFRFQSTPSRGALEVAVPRRKRGRLPVERILRRK